MDPVDQFYNPLHTWFWTCLVINRYESRCIFWITALERISRISCRMPCHMETLFNQCPA